MAETQLILNAGSSSLKFSLFLKAEEPALLLSGKVEGLGTDRPHFVARDASGTLVAERSWAPDSGLSHRAATEFLFTWGRTALEGHHVAEAGHRIVHGGARFTGPVRVDPTSLAEIEALTPLAPLHQPQNLAAIRAVAEHAPDLPQVACFDTAFHRSQPSVAQLFALPRRLSDDGIRRYGFHGLSYESIASLLPRLDPRAAAGRTVVAHLGNGASLCAMLNGKSVATTMSFTPADGLPMGTRSGSLDPGLLLYLLQYKGMSISELDDLIYHKSGLLGVSGISSDMRTLEESADPHAAEAIDLFVYRLNRELGSMAAALGGLDALVFTGGIGENSRAVRRRVVEAGQWLGLAIDLAANEGSAQRISPPDSKVAVWVIPTNEELMIARHTWRVLGAGAPH